MKAVLITLGGSVLAVTTFVGGLVCATAMFTTRDDTGHLASPNVSELWTTEPVKIDRAAQALDRVAARPSSSPAANLGTGEPGIVGANPASRPVLASVSSETQRPAVDDKPQDMRAEHLEWCAERYRSYRPRDNSYTPFGGGRRQCQSPYAAMTSSAGTDQYALPVSQAPNRRPLFEQASTAEAAREQEVAELSPSVAEYPHAQSCAARYRSYRVEDNSYQPVSGGPRRQCQ
jgi:hypothetical protein